MARLATAAALARERRRMDSLDERERNGARAGNVGVAVLSISMKAVRSALLLGALVLPACSPSVPSSVTSEGVTMVRAEVRGIT
jgi:hypothetical protein